MNKELIEELQAILNDGSPYLTTIIPKELLNRAICELMNVGKAEKTETGWNAPFTKPVKVGVYKVRGADDGKEGYQYWNGRAFSSWSKTAKEAKEEYDSDPEYESLYQTNYWKEVE